MLGQNVYVDGKMDANEHYLMNNVRSLLRLDHHRIIEAKRKALYSMEQGLWRSVTNPIPGLIESFVTACRRCGGFLPSRLMQ